MKKQYTSPEASIVFIDKKDVITTSYECDPFSDIDCGEAECDMEGIACTPGVG